MSRTTAAACVLMTVLPGWAWAGPVIETMCQKNLGDGRVLVQDEKVLPSENATFTVLSFRRTGGDDAWAEGPCTIKVTGEAR